MTHEDYIRSKEDGDNMFPKGTYAQDAMYILRDYLLGEEWNPVGPPYHFMSDESIYNTYIVEGIISVTPIFFACSKIGSNHSFGILRCLPPNFSFM